VTQRASQPDVVGDCNARQPEQPSSGRGSAFSNLPPSSENMTHISPAPTTNAGHGTSLARSHSRLRCIKSGNDASFPAPS